MAASDPECQKWSASIGGRRLRLRRDVVGLSMFICKLKFEHFQGSPLLYYFLMTAIFAAVATQLHKDPSLASLWVHATLLLELRLPNTPTHCLQSGNGTIDLA